MSAAFKTVAGSPVVSGVYRGNSSNCSQQEARRGQILTKIKNQVLILLPLSIVVDSILTAKPFEINTNTHY